MIERRERREEGLRRCGDWARTGARPRLLRWREKGGRPGCTRGKRREISPAQERKGTEKKRGKRKENSAEKVPEFLEPESNAKRGGFNPWINRSGMSADVDGGKSN